MAKKKKKKKTRKKKKKNALVRYSGAYKCYLCEMVFSNAEKLADHLYEKHDGLSLREYQKLYPVSTKPLNLSERMMTGEQLYQAAAYRSVHGRWPDWYDGSKLVVNMPVDLSHIAPAMNIFAAKTVDELGDLFLFLALAIRRAYAPADVAEAEPKDLKADIGKALGILERKAEVLFKFMDRAKEMNAAGRVIEGTFVPASALETADQNGGPKALPGAAEREGVARLSELGMLIQGYVFSGAPSLPVPPSQAVVLEEPDEEED